MAEPKVIKVPSKTASVVAMKSVSDPTVVAHGRSLAAVLRRAKRAGAENPVISFVPRPGTQYIL